MNEGMPQQVQNIRDVERMFTIGARQCDGYYRWQCVMGVLAVGAVGVAVFGGAAHPEVKTPAYAVAMSWLVGAGLAECAPWFVRRSMLELLRENGATWFQPAPLAAGDEFKSHVVLAAKPGLLCVGDRRSFRKLKVRRAVLFVAGIACAAAFGVALSLWGPLLGSLSDHVHGKEFLVLVLAFWVMPILSLAAWHAALMPHPVKWTASLAEGRITIENIVWIAGRRVREIDASSITGFKWLWGELHVRTEYSSYLLVPLAEEDFLCRGKTGISKDSHHRLMRARAERIVASVANALGLSEEQSKLAWHVRLRAPRAQSAPEAVTRGK